MKLKKLNKKIVFERKDHFIEYELKIVIPRLLLIGLFIFIIHIMLFSSSPTQNYNYSYDIYTEEDISSMNSRQDFISLNKKVFIQGSSNLFFEDKHNLITLNNFRITNSKYLQIYLATNEKGSNRIYIDKLNANIGNFKFKINKSIHLKTHNTLVIWNSKENKPWGYSYIQ